MRRNQLLTVTVALAVALFVFAPVGTVAAQDDQDGTSDELSLVVSDDGIVTVTANESGVENATVDVALDDENASYAGTGTYSTNADGEVELPEPDEEVAVTVTATADNRTAELTTTLTPSVDLAVDVTQDTDATVTVTDGDEAVEGATVDVATADGENASYADTGTYTTDENGTVSLDAPSGNESVDVVITATFDGNTAETTTTLEPLSELAPDNFGALVSQFVEQQRNETDGPLGLAVADFVVENNPGNAPDHAGPPEHAGPPGDDDEDKKQGPPDHAGQSDGDEDKKQGPPEHAGPSDDGDDSDDDSDDESDEDDGGNGGGPPDHAGPN